MDDKRISELSQRAVEASKRKIAANMRFMDPALFALENAESGYELATDGSRLLFEPRSVLLKCADGLSGLTHGIMHVMMHCIFRHFYVGGAVDRRLWDLSCDIASEEIISSLGSSCLKTSFSEKRSEALASLRQRFGRLSAERLYRSFRKSLPNGNELEFMEELFHEDDHSVWYGGTGMLAVPPDGDEDDEQRTGDSSQDDGSMTHGTVLADEPDWEKIGDMIRMSLETSGREHGTDPGEMASELGRLRSDSMDYSEFLRKFASRHEAMKVDDSSFDYIFYNYGMELYGDMPLIEPLEYSDEKRIRDLIIAVDTSGSTDGELVRTFVEKSFDILTGGGVIADRFNIHLIQCDAEIQEDVVLRSREDAEKYAERLKIKGLGGTDFRPVFRYADRLIASGEMRDLRGLLYFTDGKGTFPGKKPPYDTAFIFIGDSGDDIEVPPWAMKVRFDG